MKQINTTAQVVAVCAVIGYVAHLTQDSNALFALFIIALFITGSDDKKTNMY